MPRNPKGEMNVSEIRNLVRQHNKLSVISNVDKKSRADLIKEIRERGYEVDHVNKKIVSGKKSISQAKEAEPKPQKRTKKKALIKGGEPPVLVGAKKSPPPIPENVKGKKVRPNRTALIAGKAI
jgi:hypothetical protein